MTYTIQTVFEHIHADATVTKRSFLISYGLGDGIEAVNAILNDDEKSARVTLANAFNLSRYNARDWNGLIETYRKVAEEQGAWIDRNDLIGTGDIRNVHLIRMNELVPVPLCDRMIAGCPGTIMYRFGDEPWQKYSYPLLNMKDSTPLHARFVDRYRLEAIAHPELNHQEVLARLHSYIQNELKQAEKVLLPERNV